ncbi:helix-turn-helix domain-containing protein [Escherichia coli]
MLWIEDNLDKTITSNDIASRAGYTNWYFQRSFKKATGYSLYEYLSARKLTVAALRLCDTEASVTSVFSSVGYDTHSIFCRVFRQRFGASPSAYRNAGIHDVRRMIFPFQVLPFSCA